MLIRRTLHLCLRKLPRPSYIIPHLQADIASHILAFLGYLQTCSGFFASSLAIIRLYKLSTLSLRLFPPLKPFERRDQSTDIHDDMGRTQAHPQLTSIRYARNTRLYRDMWFEMHRSPCRQERSESRVGRAGVQSPPGGLLHHSPYRQERSESREGGVGGRSPSEGGLPKCWLFTVTSVIVFCGASPV